LDISSARKKNKGGLENDKKRMVDQQKTRGIY